MEECDRLVEMINTMLEITQTDSGTSPLVTEQNQPRPDRRAGAQPLRAAGRGQSPYASRWKTPPGPVVVTGDKMRLQRVIANLLDNAIKYTPEGGNVLLALTTGGGQARLTVKDDGAGISKDDQLRIFDRFHRCDSSRSLPGNGLGLSLVRAIVKAHGGSTTVSSVPGQGSAFTVSIPRAEQTPNSKRSKPQ